MPSTPLKAPVVAAMGVAWVRHWCGVVGCSDDLLGQRRQDLGALRGVEGGHPRGLGDGGALESWSQLLGKRAVHGGARDGRQHALRSGGVGESGPREAGTHEGGHCAVGMGRTRGERCRDVNAAAGISTQCRRQCLGSQC
jgi:hypothetical protein